MPGKKADTADKPAADLAVAPSEAMGRMPHQRPLSVGSTGVGRGDRHYHLIACIAKGGQGEVYLAEMVSEGQAPRKVIVKRLLAELRDDDEYVKMFRYEADVLSRINHPKIVAMIDVPMIDGVRCLALEYVHGRSVGQILERLRKTDRVFPPRIIASIIVDVLEALDHAHRVRLPDGSSLDLVHRDVTPGNMLVGFRGETKLTDFGIAKGKTSMVSTTVGIVKGKARYLAPEQILGKQATPRSDLFSAGLVAIEMFTLFPVYERASVPKTLQAIVEGRHPKLAGLLPKGATRLTKVFERAIKTEPKKRFESSGGMAEAVREAAAQTGGLASRDEIGSFLRDLFRGEEETWEKSSSGRPIATEAINPIYQAPAARDETERDEPGKTPQERLDTIQVREKQDRPSFEPRSDSDIDGEEETLALSPDSPLFQAPGDEETLVLDAEPIPSPVPARPIQREAPAKDTRPSSSAVFRDTVPRTQDARPRSPLEHEETLPRPDPNAGAPSGRFGLFVIVLAIFVGGTVTGVLVTRSLTPEPTQSATDETPPPGTPSEAPSTPTRVQPALVAPPPLPEPPPPGPEPVAQPEPAKLVFSYPKGGRVRLNGKWHKARIPFVIEAPPGAYQIQIRGKRKRFKLQVKAGAGERVQIDRKRVRN